ncbi:hypothetical protein LOK49_LG14G00048 [Camellia lanceoleosa]|uniref:Uncharacterized protein n=1 Tax=Camellia lanceoleosa TaxID=1840588 RepID=A0ACC0F808_9ERIC|nr:hypothetical protein LOK49_LG14G00048 [Camellia lanceoleosa]
MFLSEIIRQIKRVCVIKLWVQPIMQDSEPHDYRVKLYLGGDKSRFFCCIGVRFCLTAEGLNLLKESEFPAPQPFILIVVTFILCIFWCFICNYHQQTL